MKNLLHETEEILRAAGKTLDDLIVAVGNDFQFPISDFIKLADTEYDDGYGAPEVATDLILLGRGFWLERAEYDGSEWWEFMSYPLYQHLPVCHPKALTVRQAYANGNGASVGWSSMFDLNPNASTKTAEPN